MYKHLLSLSFLVAILLLVGAACTHVGAPSVTFVITSGDPSTPLPSTTTVTLTLTNPPSSFMGANPQTMTPTLIVPTNPSLGLSAIFPDLPAGTQFSFDVHADGFTDGTTATNITTTPYKTPASGGEEVDVQLQPIPQQPAQLTFNITSFDPSKPLPPAATVLLNITNPPANFTQPKPQSAKPLSGASIPTLTTTFPNLPPKAAFTFQVAADGFFTVTPTNNPTQTGEAGSNLEVDVQVVANVPYKVTFNTFFIISSRQSGTSATITFKDSNGNPVLDPATGGLLTVQTLQLPNDPTIDSGSTSLLPGTYTYTATLFSVVGTKSDTFTVPFTPVVNIDLSSLLAVPVKVLPPSP